MNSRQMNSEAVRCHHNNAQWWKDINSGKRIKRDKCELLALVISELSECLEGERKNLMDDKLPHRKMAEVEMADALIRLLDFAGGFSIALGQAPTDVGSLSMHKPRALFQIMRVVTKIEGSQDEGLWITMSIDMIKSYCRKFNYDLLTAYEEKIAFNKIRADHKIEARQAPNGKKY